MASIFRRKLTWWVKFKHPATGKVFRESLQTQDEAKAELLCQRIALEVALQEPRFQAAQLPDSIWREIAFFDRPREQGSELLAFPSTEAPTPHPGQAQTQKLLKRMPVEDAVKDYLNYIRADNAPRHVENKISMFRRFLGSERVEKILLTMPTHREKKFKGVESKAFFSGIFLDEITAPLVQRFIETLPVIQKTKRHYREMFHHFFEVCLKFELCQPTSWHRPNPISALPGYVTRNRHISFLSESQIEEQMGALQGHPEFQIAVGLMIYGGLRRSEALWLAKESIAPDLSYFSIVNRVDAEDDIESSLKTGERSVTILPPLRALLREYLPKLKSQWVVPNASGKRWSPDGFSAKLKSLNRGKKLNWTCLTFRHTYATQRAAEGWSLHRISREMGNSPGIVDEYYAGYIRPPELTEAATSASIVS
ncbi:MAG: site-specific integrase [Verrucomicrobiota bacterium]